MLRCVCTGLYFYFLHTDGQDGKGIFDDDKRSKEKGRQQSSNTKKAMWENNLENTQRSEEQMTRE